MPNELNINLYISGASQYGRYVVGELLNGLEVRKVFVIEEVSLTMQIAARTGTTSSFE